MAEREAENGFYFETFVSGKEVDLLKIIYRMGSSNVHTVEDIAREYNSDPQVAEKITVENTVGELKWLAIQGLVRKEQKGRSSDNPSFGISGRGMQLSSELIKNEFRGGIRIRTSFALPAAS